jgi:hypothetical protein
MSLALEAYVNTAAPDNGPAPAFVDSAGEQPAEEERGTGEVHEDGTVPETHQ